MAGGYAGKFLEVNLYTEKITETEIPDEVLSRYLGGRGLAAWILWDKLGERWGSVDPLGPENLLLALTGPLTGYFQGTRICVSGKSPQSNGIIGSTSSGEFPMELKCAGWDGVIISGRASGPVYLLIDDDNAEIRDARHLWGLDGKKTVKTLTKETRSELERRHSRLGKMKEPGLIYIGPAGENRVRVAAVMQKWSHACGYGGYGAVMGSKNLKAIVAKGKGPLPPVAEPKNVENIWEEAAVDSMAHDRIRRWGTGYGGYEVGANLSAEPVRNWQDEWHEDGGMGGPRFDLRYWVKRYWGDYGCPITCMKLGVIKTGPYKGAISDCPDYELEAYEGPNLGVFNAEGVLYLSALIDELGLSGINGGNVMAFAAELYQRGILKKEDLDGLEPVWGDVDAFAELARRISAREGEYYDILAEGTYRAALKISEIKGVDVTPFAVHVKGVEVGAHGTRSGLDLNPIAYACSVQGGDHTSSVSDAYSDMDRVFFDSAVVCSIATWRLGETVWRCIKPVTGWDITQEKWRTELAPRIIHIQQAAQLLGGPDTEWRPGEDDDNPPRFYEPLPSGPHKGETTDREEFRRRRSEYYQAIGWDESGIPRSETLHEVGLETVDRALAKLRQ